MSKYQLNKKIHSCTVDKNLLLNLEDCILNRIINKIIGEYLNEEVIEKYRNNYTLSIQEKDGLEEFESIKDYKHPLFPNDTKEIILEVNLMIPEIPENNIELSYISIKIVFDDSLTERIEVNINSKNKSKYIASNIYDLIKESIEHKYNNNYFYHLARYFRYLKFSGFGIILTSLLFGTYLSSSIFITFSSFKYNIFISLLIHMIFWFYIISGIFNPYIVFESNKSKKHKRWYNNLKNFFIFGILVSIIVKLVIDLYIST